MNETCPACQGSGKAPKMVIAPGCSGAKCFTCSGTGQINQRAVAQHKCLQCGNYHSPGMPCPHMLTWC